MKRFFSLLLTGLLLSLVFVACNKQDTSTEKTPKTIELNVSAAASLKDALEEINTNYKEATGNTVLTNFAGSGKLRQQILEGAPTDIFISASKSNMDALVEKELVDEKDVSILLNNELVMIAPKSNSQIQSIQELESIDGKIAIGEVETVPAGKYANEALTNLGLWDKIEDKIVYAKDVRSVLSYVEQGEVVAGFVYKSDTNVAENSVIVETVDSLKHKAIVYPVAVIKSSPVIDEAKKYEEFLKSEESMKIFEKFGFKTVNK